MLRFERRMNFQFEDSYWSTQEGLALIAVCHQMYLDYGYDDCLEFCIQKEHLTMIPIFEEINNAAKT